MIFRGLVQCLCLVAVAAVPLVGQNTRVELFSGKKIAELTIEAGGGSLRICGPPRRDRCLEVKAGGHARCVAAKASVRCMSGEQASEFQTASFLASEPFRLTAPEGRTRDG